MNRTIAEFEGIDRRRQEALDTQKTARMARNVYLTTGRVWRTRPGTRRFATLPPETKGLYPAAGVLRTIAPAGYIDLYNRQSPTIFFDFVGDGTVYDRDDVAEFINAERFGSSLTAGVQPYGVIRRRSTGRLEHHWFRDRPDTPVSTVNNLVRPGFVPTGPVIKLAQKLWTPDQANGSVRFSSTQFGPSDWTTLGDAGFLPALANTPGDHTMTALSWLQSTGDTADRRQSALVVFFEDSIQIWAVDPDPENHFLTGNIGGVGTRSFRSVANVFGDPVFFSRAGFASLSLSYKAGALDTGRIGAPIEDLTALIDPADIRASVWWDAKGLYLAAVGREIYVWQNDPLMKVRAWSIWDMPYEITDFADYSDGLYFRTTGDEVYKFTDDHDDDNGTPIAFDVDGAFMHLGTPGSYKVFHSLTVIQDGASRISYRPDSTEPAMEVPIYTASGVTRPHERIPLIATADSLALRFQGNAPWSLSGYTLNYDDLGR